LAYPKSENCSARYIGPFLISLEYDISNVPFPMQVTVSGANNEAEAAKIARSVASSSLVKVR